VWICPLNAWWGSLWVFFIVIVATLLVIAALFYCHCERSAAIPAGHEIASALECLAMTEGAVIANPFFIVIASRRRGNLGGV